ncbi:MAG: hypothetical protein F4X97_11150 [Boseongicola sp. SB0662_bin_57]|nr:hypothetical protein [Boseongicola sp. SB0662_bin_57]
MKANWKLLPAALTVAMLALAGCGGGSDTAPTTPTDPTTPAPPEPTALENASDAQANALAAKAQAEMLLKNAVAASKKLGTKAVDGSSKMASDNATLVLMAEAAIMAEHTKAMTAHMAAQAAHTAAPAAQKARIAAMVMAAKDAMDAIKAILDAKDTAGTVDDNLAEAVARVKTGAKTTDTDAMIAQAKAKAVATAIAAAIKAQIPAPTATPPVTLDLTASSTGAPAGAVMKAGLVGMTFAEIAGGNVKLATSIKDFKSGADPATSTAFTLPAAGATTPITDTATDATYMGIPGALSCLAGETCSFDSTGKITGAVNFTPSSQTTLWAQATYGGDYKSVTNAATYGHWLNTAGTAVMLHANSLSTGLDWTRAATSTTVTTAKYTGKAGGYSEKTTGTGAAATRASGMFTADVTLNASFGAAAADARLGGSISNFAGGAHVDTDWHVSLAEQTDATNGFAAGTVDITKNQAGREDAISGGWQAFGYGETGKNPSGFVGIFSADFDNGSSAGSFETSKSAN